MRPAPPTKMKTKMMGIEVMNSNIPTSTIRSGQVTGDRGLDSSTSPKRMNARGLLRIVCESQVNG